MAIQDVTNLRSRILRTANDLTNIIDGLAESVAHADGAVFGYRPTPTMPAEKESPVADSIEGELGRIERLTARLAAIAKDAAEFEARLSGATSVGGNRFENAAPAVSGTGRW